MVRLLLALSLVVLIVQASKLEIDLLTEKVELLKQKLAILESQTGESAIDEVHV